jgi:CelD/BcsL family acetyltransferase involved in cellulose biosynthesis
MAKELLGNEAGIPVVLVGDVQALSPLEQGWERLRGPFASPMQSFAWARACVESFHRDHSLSLVVLGEPERPLALAPLVRRGRAPLELIGVRELSEPTGFLYSEPEALEVLARALVRLDAPLRLGRVLMDSPLSGALQRAFQHRGLVATSGLSSCPFIPLDEGWAEPESKLNAGRRSDLRRMLRRAEKIGPVRCEVLSPTPAELEPLLQAALEVEARSWKGQQGFALLRDPSRLSFFQRYATAAAERGELRLCFLWIGERLAAMELAVETGGSFWLLKIGYDQAFASCSPGALLLAQVMRHAALRGLRTFEFLGGKEPWTQVWTQDERPTGAIRIYPAGAGGVMALGRDAVSVARRRLKLLGGANA